MNNFITFSMVICAYLAVGSCLTMAGINAHPAAQSSYSAIGSNYAGSALDYGNLAASVDSYAAPALAPVLSSISSYSRYAGPMSAAASDVSPSAQVLTGPAQVYAQQPNTAKAGTPRYTVRPAAVAQLTPGPQVYKTYASPPLHSKVVLPVSQSPMPVAKLFMPQSDIAPADYASNHHQLNGGYMSNLNY